MWSGAPASGTPPSRAPTPLLRAFRVSGTGPPPPPPRYWSPSPVPAPISVPSRSPQYWLVGRQVKCHPAGSQPCCGRRGCGSWHICPIPSPRSCLQKWRTCSRTTSYQRNGIVANGKSSLAYPRGPCLSEHTWQHMDSCLACNTLRLLDFAIVSLRGGLVLLSLCVVSLANSLCVCLRTCSPIHLSYLVFRLVAL